MALTRISRVSDIPDLRMAHATERSPAATVSAVGVVKSTTTRDDFSWRYGVAGSISGVMQKSCVQPLDLIKTRMQVQPPPK